MRKKTNEIVIEVEPIKLDDNGRGIFYYDNSTFFVPNLLPTEKGQVKIFKIKDKYIKDAKLIKRLTSSSNRTTPICPIYEKCGGCSLMHLNYQAQLDYKRQKVENLLHKFASIDIKVQPTIGMENPYRFRNKVQVPFRKEKGKVVYGFFEENTHNVIPSSDCLIESKRACDILKYIKSLMVKYDIEPYQEDSSKGLIRHVLIKESLHFNEIMVVLVTTKKEMYAKTNFARMLVKKFPEITTVVQNINPRHTNVILGEEEEILYGTGKIKDSIFGIKFLISAKSFYQTNPIQVEKLYSKAIEYANLTGKENVLDAYSGTGTIGICASKNAKHVTCVEIVDSSVKDARKNGQINNINNVTFIKDDCTKWMLNNKDNVNFDVVFMDPPRKGSTKEFLNALKEIKPRRVVYVSCDAVTLARDLQLLKDTFDVVEATPCDMFPHTAHVESIALLTRKQI